MFSFNHLQVSTCTFLVLLIIGMSSALSLRKEQTKRSVTGPAILSETEFKVNHPYIEQFAHRGLAKYAMDKSYKPIIVKINSARVQHVAGLLFKINVTFGETNCAKGQETNCELKENGKSETCIVEALSQTWIDQAKITVICP
ncbi:uncharacterized protein LOC122511040 [Leptopilina heterotoma]|uniref:uncharacterized protein LOC122511040 n=1 Tax=Leptopilina heterotoma TaxID=63436 RepID=UPI001CA94926|nr:uncharacterized protein LOC122511040 [Leptopilina heterotoma]